LSDTRNGMETRTITGTFTINGDQHNGL
jgi:hypothetical protein